MQLPFFTKLPSYALILAPGINGIDQLSLNHKSCCLIACACRQGNDLVLHIGIFGFDICLDLRVGDHLYFIFQKLPARSLEKCVGLAVHSRCISSYDLITVILVRCKDPEIFACFIKSIVFTVFF